MAVTRQDFDDAVAAYWEGKRTQLAASKIAGATGAGTAGSVRGGSHFDSIAALIGKFFVDAGYPQESVRLKVADRLELPGYYRPQKRWDVVVECGGVLVAAFELKALGGPSFGNNYNNRVEEALGSAVDMRRAALANLYPGEKPWLGYFFLMHDEPQSRKPVKPYTGTALPAEEIWHGRSYQQRCEVFCQRLVAEGLYDSVCYITSSQRDPRPSEPVRQLDWQHFSAAVNARITYLRDLGIPGRTDHALF